jgi:malate dehydrogenase (oxaloacetate-decarboxylating)
MEEAAVFPHEAADVAMQAIKDGVARVTMTREEVFQKAKKDIEHSRSLTRSLMDKGFIEMPPIEMIRDALKWAVDQVR